MSEKKQFIAADAVQDILEKYQVLPTECVKDYLMKNSTARKHITSREQLTAALRHLVRKERIARVSNGVYCTIPYYNQHVKKETKRS